MEEGEFSQSDFSDHIESSSALGEEEALESLKCVENEEEEDDRKHFGIYRCLPVDDAPPNWAAGEPDSAEEYLRRVRFEARQLPDIVVSPAQPPQDEINRNWMLPTEDALPTCPPAFLPNRQWVAAFLTSFANFRHQLQREEDLSSGRIDGFPVRVSPESMPEELLRESEILKLCGPSAGMEELVVLRGKDQIHIQKRVAELIQGCISEGSFSKSASELFALSLRLENPLRADSAAAYRSLLRHCLSLRAALSDVYDPLLPHLNIMIVVSGAYFGQDPDLAWAYSEEEGNVYGV